MLEALACGTPIAAYPVSGPKDVIQDPRVGVLDDVLHDAILGALNLGRQDCRNYALKFSWANCAQSLLNNLANNRNHWDGVPV
jgi:glycosyltransferase involved in cell wall biosynthesis